MTVNSFLALIFGTLLGYFFGLIPGLQSITAMVLLLPLTFGWDPIMGMYVFAGIIGASGRGGSITAIALNMPGTVQNAATALDGYPLSRQGKTSWALGVAASASMFGSAFGLILLIIALPVALPFVMAFGPAELFWVMVLGMVTLSLVLPGSFVKGLVASGIGVALATIGFGGAAIAYPRFTFGSVYLMDGIHIVPVVIGFLVVSEAIMQLTNRQPTAPEEPEQQEQPTFAGARFSWNQGLDGLVEPLRHPWLLVRSSFLGVFVGAIPGVGGSVAQFFAYNAAYVSSRSKELFGRGSVEGLLAAEAAIDAKEGGTCLPTFIFGIPGNAEMALVMAAWQVHGLQPGVFFLRNHMDVAVALILGLFVANVFATILQLICLPIISLIPQVRIEFVAMGVLVLSLIAALSVRQNLWDAGVILLMGLFGYLFRMRGFPVIGLVIGFVLGGIMEANFTRALQSSFGSLSIFVSSPIAIILMVASALIVVVVSYKKLAMSRSGKMTVTGSDG